MRSWQVFYAGRRAQCEPVPVPVPVSEERSPRPADTWAKWSEPAETRTPEGSTVTGVLAAIDIPGVTIDIPGATPQEPRDPC
ncbi:hypothetical protein [Streptomyces sp. NPDC058694]|uniref:hypothetical protein n=1 Tax=Streptomyces sp. NPDC058694 TaxID=3346603 RepID=UPI0036593F35